MGTPRRFLGANTLLKGNGDNVLDMQVRNNDGVLWSCWSLTDREIAEINRTRVAWVGQWAGGAAPMPLRLAGHRTEVFPDEREDLRYLILKRTPVPSPDAVIGAFARYEDATSRIEMMIRAEAHDLLTLWDGQEGTALMTVTRDDVVRHDQKIDTRTLADPPDEDAQPAGEATTDGEG